MVVACGGASDSRSGHGGLVMGFGFEDEELRGERGKTKEEGKKKEIKKRTKIQKYKNK